jgi:hypothetical protein
MRLVFPIQVAIPFLFCAVLCPASSAQGAPPQSAIERSAYPDNADGLRDLLQEMLTAAKRGDQDRLRILIHDAEIPDYANWFTATFGAEKGARRADLYREMLSREEAEIETRFMQLARQEGSFSVKELVATDIYDTLQAPLDIFLASWRSPDDGDLPRRPTPIAYFFFIDGKFRLDSNVSFPAIRGATAPSPDRTPSTVH